MKRKNYYTMACTLLLSLTLCVAAFAADPTAVPDATATAPSVRPVPESSVLDRFRTYDGPRTPDDLSALFTPSATDLVRQQPLIALSDGRTATLLAIKVTAASETAPGFSFSGATPVPPQRKQNDEWLFTAIPDKGVWRASLIVSAGSAPVEYPLTVAPQLSAENDLTEQGFKTFLAFGRDEASADVYDLNHDGKLDYVDDYIFTANYLAVQSTSGDSLEARRQRALKRTLSAPNTIPAQ